MHSCGISSEFFCVHKSTYWNVVNTRIRQQFYCVSCGGINNLIWIFSLHFDIRSNRVNMLVESLGNGGYCTYCFTLDHIDIFDTYLN